MIEPIAIRLTIWQATTAIVTLLVSLCSLIWTVYSKCEDWKIAKADKTEREQSEGENNASTAEKLEYHRQRVDKLEKELQQALNDNNALKKQWQESYQRLIQTQANMNARLNIMEKNRCKCNLIKSNDIDPLATKINILEAATKELSGDFDNQSRALRRRRRRRRKPFSNFEPLSPPSSLANVPARCPLLWYPLVPQPSQMV
ncbi:hypothetical protein FOVSG1_013749 [Fusarium oxysporum f. sp. vasinfectum]